MVAVGSLRLAKNGVDRSGGDVGSAGSSRLSSLGEQS
jgi:adhesin HecA-like repeat protein